MQLLSNKIAAGFLAKIGEVILKFVWKCKGPRRAKTERRMKLKRPKVTAELRLSRQHGAGVKMDIGTELTVQIQTVSVWAADFWKTIQGKSSPFNTWFWSGSSATCKRRKLDSFFTPHTEFNPHGS